MEGDIYCEEAVKESMEHPLTRPVPLFSRCLPVSPSTEVLTSTCSLYVLPESALCVTFTSGYSCHDVKWDVSSGGRERVFRESTL